MRQSSSFALSRKTLLAAAFVATAPLAEAGIFRPDIDVQTYRDFAENRGVFQPGATNVTVYKSDGSVSGVIAVMPDFASVNDGGFVTMINPSFGASVSHVGYTTSPTFSQRFNDTGLAYSIFGDTYREVASIAPSSGFDYKIMRYSKVFIDAAPAPLMTDTTQLTAMGGKQIARVGGGIQATATGTGTQTDAYPGGNNYGWLSGGFNKVDSVSTGSMTETVGGTSGSYANYTVQITMNATPDATLEIGTLGGDSGSPVFAWNTVTGRYELIALNQAGGGSGAGYGKTSYLRAAPQWSVAQMNSYNDPTIADTSGGGIIAMSAADATGLGTLTQGASVWNFHGLANGVVSSSATDAQLNAAKNLTFAGAGNILRINSSVDMGAGSMTFTGGGTYTLDDGGVNTRRLNTAGYIVESGTTLISKITGSAGDDWRKIGAGTLRIEGSGANAADLSLGEGLVELNRTGGAAVANVLITSGRGTVRLIGDNQISGTIAFGNRGGTLDLYGHNLSRDVIYAMDGDATLTNTAANTTSTLTWTGSGTGAEQTFRGGFSDGGSLAAGLLNVVINPTTAAGSVLTLRGVSNNAGGFAINGGEVVLRGYNTPHAGASGEAAYASFPDDWTYAGISTGTIAVASGAKFTLADHARLDGNVTVSSGGTFAITENLFKATAESVQGSLPGTPSSALYGHQSGVVTLNGATAAMIATVSGGTDQAPDYTRNITGTGSFTKNGVGTLTLSGTNTFSGAKTLNEGTLIGASLAALGDTTTNKWAVGSAGVIGVANTLVADVKNKLATGSTGTLAILSDIPTAGVNMGGYNNLFLGSAGDHSISTSGSGIGLTAWAGASGNGWNLGGGGGALTMHNTLNGAGQLTVGNGVNTGTVVLTGNNTYTGGTVVNAGMILRATSSAALGSGSGNLTVNYGASIAPGTGGASVLARVSTTAAGVFAVSGTDATAYNFSTLGLNALALGADGTATYSGTLTPGASGYKFGGKGALTVTSTLSGANALSADGQGYAGGVTTLSGTNTLTGGLTVSGGVVNGITGSHTLRAGSSGAFGTGNTVALGNGGVLDVSGYNASFGALTGTAGSALVNASSTASTVTIAQGTDGTMAGTIAGTGALNLVKTGAGILTLSGANTQTGTVTVNAGTLRLGVNNALGATTNAVTVSSGGSLDFAGKSAGNAVTIAGAGNGTYGALHNSSSVAITTGAITLAGNATMSGASNGAIFAPGLVNLAGNTLTVTSARLNTGDAGLTNGNIVGGANSRFFLSGAQSGAGSTGTWTLGTGSEYAVRDYNNTAVTSTKTLVLNGGAISNGSVDNGGGSQSIIANAISVNSGGTITANNGAFGLDLKFTGALSGAGTLTLTGSRAAEFQGSTSGFTGNITNATRLVMNGAADQSLSGAISGAGALVKSGATTLTLSGNNTYTGATTVNSGTLRVGSGGTSGTLGSGAASIASGASVAFNRSDAFTVANTLSGAGSVAQSGTGITTLSGANTYAGGTSVSAGTLKVTSVTGLGSGAVTMNGGTLAFAIRGLNFNSIAGAALNTGAVAGGTFTSDFSPMHNTTGTVVPANTTYAYTGKAYLTAGQWSFGENFDDAAYVKVNNTVVVNNAAWGTPTSGSITIATSGWYDIDARVWQGGGGVGPVTASGWGPGKGVGVKTGASTTDGTQFEAFGANAAGMLLGTGGTLTVANAIALASAGTLDVADAGPGGATALSGVVSGSGALTKAGTGTLLLTGANTYTGNTTIAAGTLSVSGAGTLGSGTYAGAITNNGAFTLATSANQTLSGVISGSGILTQNGAGTTTLTGANTYAGATAVNSGTLQVGNGGSTGTIGSGALSIASGATINLNRTGSLTLANAISGDGTIVNTTGTTVLTGTNTFTGTTILNGGAFVLNSATADSADNAYVVNTGGWLTLADPFVGGTATIGSLSGTGGKIDTAYGATAGTRTLGVNQTVDGTYAGVMQNAGSRLLGLAKTGSAALTLSGNNTYNGATTVTAGTLVAGHNSAFGTSAVTVSGSGILNSGVSRTLANAFTINSGGTLAGASAFTGAVTINSGGTLAAGTATTAGIQTFSGGVTLASGSSYLWKIIGTTPATAGTDFDRIVVTAGTLGINSGAILKLAALGLDYTDGFWDSNRSFSIMTKSGTGTITGSFGALDTSLAGAYSAEGAWSLLTGGAGDLQAVWTASSSMMSLQAVPEPSTYGLMGAGALAVAALVRRRRKTAGKAV